MQRFLIAFLVLTPTLRLAADDPADPGEAPVLYEDESWTHIGDGNFSPQSNGFSDLTAESKGPAVEVTMKLTEAQRATIAEDRWRSAVLTGSVIGNDTGEHGNTSPTIVTLRGREIGRITKSGGIRIVFDKVLLLADPTKPLVLRIASGKNSGDDLDDQELGTFKVTLSKEAPPKPPEPEPADGDATPEDGGDE